MGPGDEKDEEAQHFWAEADRTMDTPDARRDLQEEAERFTGSLKDGLDEDI